MGLGTIWKTAVRGVAAYYTGGASEMYYKARAEQKESEARQRAEAAAISSYARPPTSDPPVAIDTFQNGRRRVGMPSGGYNGYQQTMAVIPRAAGALRTLPGAGRSLPGTGGTVPPRGGGTVARPGGGGMMEFPSTTIFGSRATRRRYRRQNPMNVKALRRAIRRLKSFKKIEAQVNRLMPKARVASRASRGVITRSEAARALRR